MKTVNLIAMAAALLLSACAEITTPMTVVEDTGKIYGRETARQRYTLDCRNTEIRSRYLGVTGTQYVFIATSAPIKFNNQQTATTSIMLQPNGTLVRTVKFTCTTYEVVNVFIRQ